MKNIKLVMVDLDGTLLNEEKKIGPLTLEAIRKIKENNIRFGIATGRPLESVQYRMTQLGIIEYIDVFVNNNGVQVYDVLSKEESIHFPLGKKMIVEIYKLYEPLGFNYCLYDQGKLYTNVVDQTIEKLVYLNNLEPVVAKIEDLDFEYFYKLLLAIPSGRMDEIKAFYKQNLDRRYHGFQTQVDLFEFVDARVSKSVGISYYANKHGFSIEEVMTFGDTTNDVEMIKDAGWGVCMANGTADAKRVADDIAQSNDEDGVGQYLFEYFNL